VLGGALAAATKIGMTDIARQRCSRPVLTLPARGSDETGSDDSRLLAGQQVTARRPDAQGQAAAKTQARQAQKPGNRPFEFGHRGRIKRAYGVALRSRNRTRAVPRF
jgi:hypothetical protein